MSVFAPEEKLELHALLQEKGFTFEKRKIRRASKEIAEICVGTKILDKARFGTTVIGIDLDAERDPWFTAPSWESSLINSTKVPDVNDEQLKLALSAYISRIKEEVRVATKPAQPTPKPELKKIKVHAELEKYDIDTDAVTQPKEETPVVEQKESLERIPTLIASPSVPAAEQSQIEPTSLEQIIKNVTQDGVKIIKNTKGYNWEISVHCDDIFTCIDKAIVADNRLKGLLGVGE
ncbi:hypothetical protein [Methanosarcina sp.]|uniref:hypothetical protein n=1 Tax=Methanosarcina sp. TaxID=2213 RepID=UPI003BB5E9AE